MPTRACTEANTSELAFRSPWEQDPADTKLAEHLVLVDPVLGRLLGAGACLPYEQDATTRLSAKHGWPQPESILGSTLSAHLPEQGAECTVLPAST